MSSQVVVGTQWGDEGKGKIVDVLAEKADMIVRFQGGDNAGHTVIVNGKKHVLHLLPSGVLHEEATCIIGPGVVCNPFVLLKEMEQLEKDGLSIKHIIISDRAQMLMPYHQYQDELEEQAASNKIGTTKRGIGPCYADKYARHGIRYHEFKDFEHFKVRLKDCLDFKNKLFTAVYGGKAMDYDKMVADFEAIYDRIVPMIQETTHLVNEALDEDKTVLFEGAQAAMLDINYGTYPYVTSSNTTAGGVANGVGIGPNMITNAVGIAKAYTTRVGKGPFPTELENETGEWIREKGHEYGVTTGRSRRCGWLDIVILKTSVRVSGLTSLAVTKIDTLAGLEKVMMCVGYKFNDEIIDYFPASLEDLAKCEPIYEEFDGWDESVADARSYEELHPNARKYLERIEELTDTRISIVSVGPRRDQTMRVKPL